MQPTPESENIILTSKKKLPGSEIHSSMKDQFGIEQRNVSNVMLFLRSRHTGPSREAGDKKNSCSVHFSKPENLINVNLPYQGALVVESHTIANIKNPSATRIFYVCEGVCVCATNQTSSHAAYYSPERQSSIAWSKVS
jgi:hypothetical protein